MLNLHQIPSPENCKFYKNLSKLYGMRINIDKSEILLVGRVENLGELALELGCKVGMLLSSYLGLPLGAPHKSATVWDVVEERFQRRLAL
ncbi:hypothetical protein CK203_086946 [Vitis vinifera]|uniref:Reverse transcriptase domain-containing protein n=1 Tax=Vitis vinifera TaxID=29760 RepID=A0A438FK69_VITVI|nr:hypothetical protein CK203_086946 [Vitis vinifera]